MVSFFIEEVYRFHSRRERKIKWPIRAPLSSQYISFVFEVRSAASHSHHAFVKVKAGESTSIPELQLFQPWIIQPEFEWQTRESSYWRT